MAREGALTQLPKIKSGDVQVPSSTRRSAKETAANASSGPSAAGNSDKKATGTTPREAQPPNVSVQTPEWYLMSTVGL